MLQVVSRLLASSEHVEAAAGPAMCDLPPTPADGSQFAPSAREASESNACPLLNQAGLVKEERMTISKADLRELDVLCQWDDKFILTRLRDALLCFDQHAVHERIRVEALESKWLELICASGETQGSR